MRIWVIQSVVSPYRIQLFKALSATPGVEFTLCLLSKAFKSRPQWKRNVAELPFNILVPFGVSYQSSPEHEFCVNPFLFFTLLQQKPDVVVCGGYSLATVSVWLWHRLTGRRYVIWTEATLHTDGRIQGFRLWLRRLLARGAGAFVDAGTLARDYISFLNSTRSEVSCFRAYNCVDNRAFSESGSEVDSFRRARGFPLRNLLFVGKLNERKGVHRLFEIYKLLRTSVKEPVGLILVGDGPLLQELSRSKVDLRLEHMFVEGWIANEETTKYYSLASAFVLLSSVDHNPLVLFEALAAGLPIICSQGACNAVDFIQAGVNGYIVDPANTEEVLQRLGDVLSWNDARLQACRAFSNEVVGKANYAAAATAFVSACRFALRGESGSQSEVPAPDPKGV